MYPNPDTHDYNHYVKQTENSGLTNCVPPRPWRPYLTVVSPSPAEANQRAARFQQRPRGKPSVATVTGLRRKSLCIVTTATTVGKVGEGGEGEGEDGRPREKRKDEKRVKRGGQREEKDDVFVFEEQRYELYRSLHLCLLYAKSFSTAWEEFAVFL